MRIWNILLVPALVLGLVGTGEAKGKKAELSASSQLAQSLESAHNLLASADHDYHGHRVMAMHRVHTALKELGVATASRETKGIARSGKSREREPQAASDAKLREAQKILQGIAGQATGGAVSKHVKGAIEEINTALSLR